ncbi:MAG: ATP-binding cassette domain-containing protein [Lachnospiraceae bacterium]|nr:ATP-binding cassette domain-containing protein [Lachnospiraceae bacterium]
MKQYVEIKNASIHNLKGIDVKIPKNKLTVITGVSGSGKSSLAFDTLYEEGHRRYLMFSGTQFMVESESSFDKITGLSPTVAVEQRIIRQSNPRSTVGTRTKLTAVLATLFAVYGNLNPDYNNGRPLEASMFQRNSARGMCVKCLGKGTFNHVCEEKILSDFSMKLKDILNGQVDGGAYQRFLRKFERKTGISCEKTLEELSEDELLIFKYGNADTEGFITWIGNEWSWSQGKKNWGSKLNCVESISCPKCNGTGLGEQALHTTISGKNISELEEMYISRLLDFLKNADIKKSPLLEDLITKLSCMVEVGLHHLSLSRPLPTLSGGEIQRLFLASYILAEMDSVIFVFDEPTIGLHEIEKANLIRIIKRLIDAGNTVVCVEHDESFIREADYIIDMGPEAGIYGGFKIYEGGYKEFLKCSESKTAPYLTNQATFDGLNKTGFKIKSAYRPVSEKKLHIKNANTHNLKNIFVDIPLGVMTGVAGVSGSGKSSLISNTLVPKLKEILKTKCVMEEDKEIKTDIELQGIDNIKKCYIIDQRPIGRSKTSCPATYTGIFDKIRVLYAESDAAKSAGYSAGMFSRNSEGGCPACKGYGVIHYHMGLGNFIDIKCENCKGTGYLPEAMEICLDGRNIQDILEMSVEEACGFFKEKNESIYTMLNVLRRVGMGYIKLGQETPTISGGESQRIKLAKELAKGKVGKQCLYIFDEPTTGLSFHDTERLMALMDELVDMGNSVIITEHDSYILSNCDYIIELGRGGGDEGGNVIACGTPAELKNNSESIIGRYLK